MNQEHGSRTYKKGANVDCGNRISGLGRRLDMELATRLLGRGPISL